MSICVILEYMKTYCKENSEQPTFEGLNKYKPKY